MNNSCNLLHITLFKHRLCDTGSGKSVTSNLMTQDHKAISPKGGLPVRVHATVYLCVRVYS